MAEQPIQVSTMKQNEELRAFIADEVRHHVKTQDYAEVLFDVAREVKVKHLAKQEKQVMETAAREGVE